MRLSRKSHGMDEKEWMKCVQESYDEREILFPLESKQLKRLYEQDYSVAEALLKDLAIGQIYALMELCVKHELGSFEPFFGPVMKQRRFSGNFQR